MSKQPQAPKGCYWRKGTLWGRIQTGGQDIRWSLRTDNPKIASERRKKERGRVVGAQRFGEHRRTLAEALEAWGADIEGKISPKTLTRYLGSLSVLAPHLDGLYLDELDKRARAEDDPEAPSGLKLIGAIVKSRRETFYVPTGRKKAIKPTIATVKRDLTALSSVFDFCVDETWMTSNPVRDWLNPAGRRKSRLKERRDPIVLPEPGHIRMVIDAAPLLFAKMIEAALLTGARQGELGKGHRQHFDRERRQLTVIGKRNKLRVIDLEDGGEDFGFELFRTLPVAMETKALFWHRPRPGTVEGEKAQRYMSIASNFRRIVAAVAKQARKQAQDFRPFRFHDLRHVHAVNWLKSGRSIYVLQQRLGHTSVKTTEIYLQFLTAEERHIAMFGRTAAGTKSGT